MTVCTYATLRTNLPTYVRTMSYMHAYVRAYVSTYVRTSYAHTHVRTHARDVRTYVRRNQCSLPKATSSQATSNQPTSQPPSHPATNPPATHHPPTTPPAPGGGECFLRHKRHSDGGFTLIPVAGSRFCIKFGVHRGGNPKKKRNLFLSPVLFPACWRVKTHKKNMPF